MTKSNNHSSVSDQDLEKLIKDYKSSLLELDDLENEKKKIITDYIDELEKQKIERLRSSL